jgi:glycosyltransferase involved in cell wall biosynthesis
MRADLLIILPAFNIEAWLKQTLDTILLYLKDKNLFTEFIVIDAGSSHYTIDVAQKSFVEFLEIKTKVVQY